MKTIDRRTFIAGGAAVAAGIVRAQSRIVNQRKVNGDPDPAYDVEPVTDAEFDEAVKLLRGTTMFDDAKRAPALAVVQRAIDRMVASRDFTAAMRDSTSKAKVEALLAKYPVMRWYDESFDRILDEFEATTVTGDTPAIWYLYNMGVLVKTKTCAFGIDICHRKAARLANHLDFLLVTHNHGDHLNMRLIGAMSGAGKPVISNFHLAWDWYCRDMEKTFKYKDVTIHTVAADHNKHLPWAVTTFEVKCGKGKGAYTIFHSGDCNRFDHLKPKGRPDVYFGHCAIGLDFMAAAKKTMPAKLFVPVHHQELGHIHSRWRCVAFEDGPLPIVKSLCDAGYKAAMPVWGDRVV